MTNAQFDNLTAFCASETQGKVTTSHTIRISCKEQVDKILVCSVDSSILSYECITGQATVSGKNNVKLVFADSDGNVYSCNSSSEYSDIVTHGDITPTSKLLVDVVVVDHKTDIIGNIVTVQLLIDVLVTVYKYHSAPHLVEGGNLLLKHKDVEILDGVDCINITAEISSQLTATCNIQRVIMADARVSIADYSLSDKVLTVSGDCIVGLLYQSDKGMVYDQLHTPYRTEIDCPVVSGQLCIRATIKNTRIKLDILEEELNNIFTADVTVCYNVLSMSVDSISIVEDCYSKTSNVVATRQPIKTTLTCGSVSCARSVEQSIADIANAANAIAIVNVASSVTGTKCVEGIVMVEGILCGTVLFESEGKCASSYVELPFAEKIDIDYMVDGCIARATAIVTSATVKGHEDCLTIHATMVIDVFSCRNVEFYCLSNIEQTPLDVSSASAIEICLAQRGETLWDIGKSLHLSEEDILAINPDIVSPLENDTKIVIYNRI